MPDDDTIPFRIADLELTDGFGMGLWCRVVYTSLDGTITFEAMAQSALFVPLLTLYQKQETVYLPRAQVDVARQSSSNLIHRTKKDDHESD